MTDLGLTFVYINKCVAVQEMIKEDFRRFTIGSMVELGNDKIAKQYWSWKH